MRNLYQQHHSIRISDSLSITTKFLTDTHRMYSNVTWRWAYRNPPANGVKLPMSPPLNRIERVMRYRWSYTSNQPTRRIMSKYQLSNLTVSSRLRKKRVASISTS